MVQASRESLLREQAIEQTLSDLPASLVELIKGYHMDLMNMELQRKIDSRLSRHLLLRDLRGLYEVDEFFPFRSHLRHYNDPRIVQRTFNVQPDRLIVDRTNSGNWIKSSTYHSRRLSCAKMWWEDEYVKEQAEARRKICGRIVNRPFNPKMIPVHTSIRSLTTRLVGLISNGDPLTNVDQQVTKYLWTYKDGERERGFIQTVHGNQPAFEIR